MYNSLFTNMNKNLQKWFKVKPANARSDLSVVILANLRAVVVVFSTKMEVVSKLTKFMLCLEKISFNFSNCCKFRVVVMLCLSYWENIYIYIYIFYF